MANAIAAVQERVQGAVQGTVQGVMGSVGQQIWDRPPPNPSISLPGPGRPEDSNKRRLLLIYVHGFQGDEKTFQEFPKHVHGLVADLLTESHVVYTRIYPRYKSQGELQTAVNQFSAWLAPHQASDLDVILIGHSIGGILCADVALLQNGSRRKHQILGLIAYDTPFLGLHPRIISDGIKSFWPRKEDESAEEKIAEEEESLGMDPAYKPNVGMERTVAPDPNFNPPFRNDKRQPDRGFLGGMKHFVEKKRHDDCFTKSLFDRFVSPAKFANCVNNYTELRQRYQSIKELERQELKPHRLRFINYYTASQGRLKVKPSKKLEEKEKEKSGSPESTPPLRENSLAPSMSGSDAASASMSSLSLAENASFSPDQTREMALSETTSLSTTDTTDTTDSGSGTKADKPKKPQKFVLLPSYHWKSDNNKGWAPVMMGTMDAVVAHQSMFLPTGPHYDYLLGDTIALIEKWVQDDLSRRMLELYES
ncbi:hypothetical protein N7478_005066 [Penicillium angulare]|uniref:uncharacterized protein n=1 Tax=Penicillium angulare TaxID=116970 RepID=UPI002541C2AA|nr:uncharacterized protein N7478_005066 [Penicillium angulare]KAJ5279694.1 hypothetical protein N7478_005066 [Penicillium angulare]